MKKKPLFFLILFCSIFFSETIPLRAQLVGKVNSISFNADGELVAGAGREGNIYIFNAESGEELRVIKGAHKKAIRSLAFSPTDETLLVTASDDRLIKVWNARTGKLLQSMSGLKRDILSVSFSYDGTVIATGSYDNTIRFWDVSTGELLRTMEAGLDQISALTFSPNSRVIAAVMSFGSIAFWDVQKAKLLAYAKDHYVKGMAFSPDSKFLATASQDGNVRLWSMVTGTVAQTLKHNAAIEVNAVAFNTDAQLLASGSSDNFLRIWDPLTGKLLFEHMDTDFVYAVAFSPDGSQLASGGDSKAIRLWKFREPVQSKKRRRSKPEPPPEPPLPPPTADIPKHADAPPTPASSSNNNSTSMSALENEVVSELNRARTNPQAYAAELESIRPYFKGKRFEKPGETAIITSEGVDALDEAIRYLKGAKPIGALKSSNGLAKAAKDHCNDQGPTGKIGHTGSNGSDMGSRMNRYGTWKMSAGENIAYGSKTAREIVIQLIVDDGVPSRGHRVNIFNSSFNVVGIGIGAHSVYRTMCVQNFAGGYDEK
ncbi:MAG: CAP domain-containing protein [Chloroherpetonaceae bacterium]|nr:CAP domain-containing protein [Chloroherpetonaceae bacterium]